MKLILSGANQAETKSLMQDLETWGFHVMERSTESSIITLLKAKDDIRIVVVDNETINLERLCSTIRATKTYVHLIQLCNRTEPTKTANGNDLPDLIIQKPVDRNRLRFQLYGIRKAVEFSLGSETTYRSQSSGSRRQVLNLETIAANFKNQHRHFKKRLSVFLKELKAIDVTGTPIDHYGWFKWLTEAETLGCEQVGDQISGIVFLLLNKGAATFFNQGHLLHQLSERIETIETGMENLAEFGFFNHPGSNSPKNVLEGRHILLVEDMPSNRALLKKILEKQHCFIHEATNGENAIENWQKLGNIDVVIMDMNMPVMDGFEATQRIRAIESKEGLKRTPIIALTALAMRGDKELCLQAGTDDYLPKPVEASSLIKACRNLLTAGSQHKVKYRDSVPELNIKNALLKSQNQISLFILTSIFGLLDIELEINDDPKRILNGVIEEAHDLIIMESESDLELAYFIKDNFRKQQIALLTMQGRINEHIPRTKPDRFVLPIQFEQILNVLESISDQRTQARQQEEKLADVDSLGKINRQASIDEAVHKSANQLAVWQKAFRKIGGDLVISHQFNMHGKFGLILGDVSGHDIQSGYTASWFSGLVEGIWGQFSNPYKLLVNLNNLFAHDTEEENKRFVCSLVLLWDPLREKLQYANAGIPGGIFIKKDTGKSEFMDWKGVPIGMFPDTDMYDHGEVHFSPGDRLIVATDGVLEAIPREIISGLSESSIDKSARQTLDGIVDFVTRSIEIVDDLTIAVFEGNSPELPRVGYRQAIESDFKAVDQAIEQMHNFLQTNQGDRFDWSMISVAVREALINAIEHGNKKKASLPVDIDFELTEQKMIVTVSDCGSGFDLSSEKKRLAREGDLRIHGRGIEIMENIASSVVFRGGGVKIVFDGKGRG